jgi:peptidoglycan/xylan/chitin deacetylase (PgdA/CDA1 family)
MSDKRKARVLFFWDYDAQWGADRSRLPGGPKTWGYLEFENTELLLDLHARYEIPACFAVVGSVALPGTRPYHDPKQILRIHEAGHEIASHSFRHDWLPGLGREQLRESLRCSKEALEQCISAPVTSFVPPWNQPFDYPAGMSFSLSERRDAGIMRTDLARLCQTLFETGYRFCRVAYRPIRERLIERILRRTIYHPSFPEVIAGVTCTRLNTPGGFMAETELVLEMCLRKGGLTVVYGHPHSLRSGNSQDLMWLEPFLQKLNLLKARGLLDICLPRDLLNNPDAAALRVQSEDVLQSNRNHGASTHN